VAQAVDVESLYPPLPPASNPSYIGTATAAVTTVTTTNTNTDTNSKAMSGTDHGLRQNKVQQQQQIIMKQQYRIPNGPIVGPFTIREPSTMMNPCPHCHEMSKTKVHTFPNWVTWASVLLLLCVGMWPFFWIPLVMTKTKQTDHYCVSCNKKVYTVGAFKDCCESRKG